MGADETATPTAAALGRWGEQTARSYFEQCGYTCLEERFRCVAGEIDLVVSRPGLVVFVEVKVRGRRRLGAPEEAVNRRKLARMYQVARHWLWQRRSAAVPVCRFDVVAVSFSGDGAGYLLRHLRDVR
jgi:putative endonuclease